MYKYKLYGLKIESDINFTYLQETDDNETDILIHEDNVSDEVMSTLSKENALEKHYVIGFEYSVFENSKGYYLIRNGTEIKYELKKEVTKNKIQPFLLGFSISMAMLQRKIMAFHCSAVANDNRVILISGFSGAGKSTIARRLIDKGFKMLADDIAAVRYEENRNIVYPTFPFQKLCSNEMEKLGLDTKSILYIDEDKGKFLVPVNDVFENSPQELKALVFMLIGKQDKVTVEKIQGIDHFFIFKNSLFLKTLNGDWEEDDEFISLCLKMAAKCPAYLIIRPNGIDSTDEIADIIMNKFNDIDTENEKKL